MLSVTFLDLTAITGRPAMIEKSSGKCGDGRPVVLKAHNYLCLLQRAGYPRRQDNGDAGQDEDVDIGRWDEDSAGHRLADGEAPNIVSNTQFFVLAV